MYLLIHLPNDSLHPSDVGGVASRPSRRLHPSNPCGSGQVSNYCCGFVINSRFHALLVYDPEVQYMCVLTRAIPVAQSNCIFEMHTLYTET